MDETIDAFTLFRDAIRETDLDIQVFWSFISDSFRDEVGLSKDDLFVLRVMGHEVENEACSCGNELEFVTFDEHGSYVLEQATRELQEMQIP